MAASTRSQILHVLVGAFLLIRVNGQAVSHLKVTLANQCDVAFTWSIPNERSQETGLKEVHYAPSGGVTKVVKVGPLQSTSTWLNRTWLRATVTLEDARRYDIKVGGLDATLHLPACVTTMNTSSGRAGTVGSSQIAVVGELGLGPNSSSVLSRMSKMDFETTLHLGDMAQSLAEAGPKALEFMEMLQPITSKMPFMTLPADPDELEIYQLLFKRDAPWYSFTVDHVKFIMLWTDAVVDLGAATPKWSSQQAAAAKQLQWLEKELASARTLRPWIIVAGRRPLYCSVLRPTCSSEAARLRAVLEPLFVKYGVDLYFSSGVHAYERSFRVLNGSICSMEGNAACGPVHLVNGDAGDPPLEYVDLPARFTAQRHPGLPGYGELVVNATILQYRQLEAVSGLVSDQLVLTKRVVELPEDEENFLEAVGWLAFATALATGTCGFVKWVHADGLKRRNEALRHLRTEIAVLSGLPIKAHHEAEFLVDNDARGLH